MRGHIAGLVLGGLLVSTAAWAQSGAIEGRVVDSSAAVVAFGNRENSSVLKRRSRPIASMFSRPPYWFGIQLPSGRL